MLTATYTISLVTIGASATLLAFIIVGGIRSDRARKRRAAATRHPSARGKDSFCQPLPENQPGGVPSRCPGCGLTLGVYVTREAAYHAYEKHILTDLALRPVRGHR